MATQLTCQARLGAQSRPEQGGALACSASNPKLQGQPGRLGALASAQRAPEAAPSLLASLRAASCPARPARPLLKALPAPQQRSARRAGGKVWAAEGGAEPPATNIRTEPPPLKSEPATAAWLGRLPCTAL